jgi:hypothetical protein
MPRVVAWTKKRWRPPPHRNEMMSALIVAAGALWVVVIMWGQTGSLPSDDPHADH